MKGSTMLLPLAVIACASLSVTALEKDQVSTNTTLPHILFVLVDDFGWADVGYHRDGDPEAKKEVVTPTIDALVSEGVELDRHCSCKIINFTLICCAPFLFPDVCMYGWMYQYVMYVPLLWIQI